ncbi:MAG: flavohemoglobin expression-modulating QEGLA motif protein [Ilumatobacter sp.]|uniref:flavohemoglobin expression-modulating QEGLA motif protein n=1 Tax=Ilumatobacter sp. TaxID=1967498 RepID=UPI00329A048F
MPGSANEFREAVRGFSDELVALQQPIRILDAVAWGDDVAAEFFAAGCRRQPNVDAEYYAPHRPLRFEPEEVRAGFTDLRSRISRGLGGAPVAGLLVERIDEYLRVIDMLDARGTPAFSPIASELYGGIDDGLHPDGPTLADLGVLMDDALTSIDLGTWQPPEEHSYTAETGVDILRDRLAPVCGDELRVIIDDGIVADAAAGGDYIKLRADAMFSARDLRVLEVHEGWVHVATTLNGRHQPWCTFLGKGTPSTTSTQEGLAVFTEITTMSSTPDRLRKVTRRVLAIKMAQEGGTFLDVFRWFVDEGLAEADAWASSVRVFRGSTPTDGPFTKDLVYTRGFLEVYDFMRLAVKRGLIDRLPLLFAGKLAVRELGVLAHLVEEGLLESPSRLPPHVADISALASWMAYSNLLNRIDLNQMETHLGAALD